MILNWMRDVEAGELCEMQAGFRPKHSCEEHMLTLLSKIENCQDFPVLFASSISALFNSTQGLEGVIDSIGETSGGLGLLVSSS